MAAPGGYLRKLADQRGFVVTFVASAALTSLAITYAVSEKYESSAAISYRVQEVTRFKPQQNEALGSPAPQAPFKVIGSTLQEVLKSDAVLRDVVVAMHLDEKPSQDYAGPWYKVWYAKTRDWVKEQGHKGLQLLKYGRIVEEDPTTKAIDELRSNIKVINRDSYIFHLQVRDKSPERAAQITDHVAKVLANWLLEFDRQPGRTRLEQLRTLRDSKSAEMARRRAEIESLLAANRVGSVQLETEKLTERLSALQLEEARLSSDIARAEARMSSVQKKLLMKKNMLGEGAPAGDPGEVIPPEDFRKLASEGVFDDLEYRALVAKQASIKRSIEQLSDRLRGQPRVQGRLDTLKMELSTLEREYTLLNDGVQEAEVRSTSPVSEVRILHPAIVPTTPVAPIKVYHVLLATSLGLLLSLGLVYLLDYFGITVFFSPPRRPRPAPAAPTLDDEVVEPTPAAPRGD